MDLQEAENSRARQAHGRGYHAIQRQKIIAPSKLPRAYHTALGKALHTLAPWGWADYPGFAEIASATFLGRASPHTIRDWRRGKRKAPMWAIALLRQAIADKRSALDHADSLLEAEQTKRGAD